jgi:trimeric autotransporter adhesin
MRGFGLLPRIGLAWLTVTVLGATEHRGVVMFTGLPVPGATVTASQGNTKLVAITDQQGVYQFLDLASGIWTMQVEMLCFAPIKRDIDILPDAPSPVWDLKLLPLDDIKAVARRAPPIPAAPPAAAATGEASKADDQKRPAAARPDFERAELNQMNSAAPGAEISQAIADFGDESALDAFVISGSASSGIEKRAIGNARRGPGRLYHGGLNFIIDDSALNARSFSLTGQDTPQPGYNRMRFGIYLGGPLVIPHVLRGNGQFFVGYQMTRNRNASTQAGLVPTSAMREGDFSRALDALGEPVRIYDPATGAPVPGGRIPISSQAQALLALYPQPNFAGSSGYNYQVPILSATRQDDLQSRVGKMLSPKNVINTAFAWRRSRTESPNLLGFMDTNGMTGFNASANLRRMFTPRLNMNFGVQYSRSTVRLTPFFANRRNVSAEAGITGNNQEPENWGPPSLNFSSGIAELSDAQQSFTRNQTSGVSYTGTWMREPHTFTFGADFRRQQFNDLSQQDPRGSFTFTGAATQQVVNGVPVAGTGSDFADFLFGIPDTASIAFGNADKYFRSSLWDAYFTDDWRVSSAVTVNIGLRWEYNSPITEKYGRLVNLDIAPGFAAAEPVLGRSPIGPLTLTQYSDSLVHPDKRAFQPRVAFAWRPFAASSTVVRAGYGVYYNTSVYQTIAMQMAQQSPLSKNLSVSNSAANPLSLASGFNASPANTPNTFAIDPNFQVGYAQNWQLSMQQDLPGAMVATVSYLGTKGTRGVQQFLPNTYPAGAANRCPACPSGYVYMTSNGNSTRQAAQAEVRRRLHSGIAASAHYTFARAFDDAQLGGRGQGSAVIAQNWLDLKAERGPSNFDQRHLLRVQAQYTTGMGVGGGALLRGWKGAAFKGWTLLSQITVGSGLPETPIYPSTVKGTGVTGSIRPDATGVSAYTATPGRFLNPAAFRAPMPGAWGNAGRNSLTGPGQFSLDASLGRSWDRFDLRFDATNMLNHVTFPSWNAVVISAQFGLPMTANPMRTLQATLRMRF